MHVVLKLTCNLFSRKITLNVSLNVTLLIVLNVLSETFFTVNQIKHSL